MNDIANTPDENYQEQLRKMQTPIIENRDEAERLAKKLRIKHKQKKFEFKTKKQHIKRIACPNCGYRVPEDEMKKHKVACQTMGEVRKITK